MNTSLIYEVYLRGEILQKISVKPYKDKKTHSVNVQGTEEHPKIIIKSDPKTLEQLVAEFKETADYKKDLNEKKIAIIDIYSFYSNEVNDLLNYSKIIFPSEELLNDLVNAGKAL